MQPRNSTPTHPVAAYQFLRTKNPHLKYIVQMDDHRPLVASPANGPKIVRMADALAAVRSPNMSIIAHSPTHEHTFTLVVTPHTHLHLH